MILKKIIMHEHNFYKKLKKSYIINNIDTSLKNDIHILILELWSIIIVKWFALVFKMKIYNKKIVF
jgi:ligand-binding SRPBCC domain-containing protein